MKKEYSSLLLFTLLLFGACTQQAAKNDNILSVEDIMQIRQISKDYTEGWLANDSSRVLKHYADLAIINPSGLPPKVGIEAITEFWFPNDSSTTNIHHYNLELLDIYGNNNLAYSYEHGDLSFTYEKDDFKMDREAESFAITVYRKSPSGSWKIAKRMWTDMRK